MFWICKLEKVLNILSIFFFIKQTVNSSSVRTYGCPFVCLRNLARVISNWSIYVIQNPWWLISEPEWFLGGFEQVADLWIYDFDSAGTNDNSCDGMRFTQRISTESVDAITRGEIVQFKIACLWVQKEKLIGKQVMNGFFWFF